MKRLLGVAALVMLGLSGCSLFVTLFNPVVGTWEYTGLFGVTTATFQSDKTVVETWTVGDLGFSKSGIWSSEGTTLTITWSDSSIDTYTYLVSPDRSQMTVTWPNGVTVVMNRV